MSPALPLMNLVSGYATGKARQIRRDAMLMAFVGLMAWLASAALLGAFAVWIAQTYGLIAGLMAAAGLAILLAGLALLVRAVLRMRARRQQRQTLSSSAATLGVVTASSLVTRHKGVAIVAGLALGALAAYASRSDDS
ncbi:hypothetical protein [Hoeflea sp.]|uniref:hypothetical protein n=2 Tax=unclassified Hoeflea TaxID=2614931 RepID=UPI003A8F2E0A